MNRRQLLLSSAAVLVAPADAQIAQFSGGPWFNGHRVGVNFNYVGSGYGGFEFINRVKTASMWQGDTDHLDPTNLDSNGYPTSIVDGKAEITVTIPTQAERPGNYKWMVDGTGTVNLTGVGSTAVSGTDTTFTFTPASGSLLCRITATNAAPNNIRNIRCFHVDDEAAFLAGQVFQQGFKNTLRNYGMLRFLNWEFNNSNVRLWSERKPTTYYSYAVDQFPAALIATTFTTTSAITATVDYSLAFTGFSLVNGARAICRFDANQAIAGLVANATLDINGTGAKSIILRNGLPFTIGSAFSTSSNAIQAGYTSSVYYDSALDAYIVFNTVFGSRGLSNSVPPELHVQLCNEIGAHGWWPSPTLASDAPGDVPVYTDLDYLTGFLTYARNNMVSGLKCIIEPPNETWNSQFFSTQYGQRREDARTDGTSDFNNWYGQAASLIGQLASNIFAGNTNRYAMVIGFQLASGPPSGSTLPRVDSTKYCTRAANAALAAKNFATHFAPACYWYPYASEQDVIDWTAEWPTATAARRSEIADTWVDGSVTPAIEYNLTGRLAQVPAFVTSAISYGKRLAIYEGGFSLGFTGTTGVNEVLYAMKSSDRTRVYSKQYYTDFHALDAICEWPMEYQFSGGEGGGRFNDWSILDPNRFQLPLPPRYVAAREFG